MRMYTTAAMVICVAASYSSSLMAGPRDRPTIEDAIGVVGDLEQSPKTGVPPELLKEAEAVIIAPHQVKGGFIVAGRYGHGVLLVRQKNGDWSDPVFVTLGGGSFGLQVGVQATDLFLIIRNQKSLGRIMQGNGKVTLGADISVAAGPLGRQASANTDAQMKAEILSYSRSRGIFGGVAIEGDAIRIDWDANERFYGRRDLTVASILDGKQSPPETAAKLRAALLKLQEKGASKPSVEPILIPNR